MAETIEDLKKDVFYEMLNLAGRVFILVNHSENVVIGTRGFLNEEKEKGLVLVFNTKMQFEWDDEGISARLVFGPKTEKCSIPSGSIVSIFSPELSAHFSVGQTAKETAKPPHEPKPKKSDTEKDRTRAKVVKVDFGKKK